jgi:serine/threonine-protein phosphatase 2A regulatory subunit B'
LSLWNNEYFVSLVSDSSAVMVPILFPALYKSSKTHWNRSIHALVYHALKVLMEINGPLFDECSHNFKVGPAYHGYAMHSNIMQAEQQKEKKKEKESQDAWAKIEALAVSNPLAKSVCPLNV